MAIVSGITSGISSGISSGINSVAGSYPTDPSRAAFSAWLASDGVGTDADVLGMPYNFVYPDAPAELKFVYPRLTAEKILWHLSRGEVSSAATAATKLISHQATGSGSLALDRRRGGWPSVLAEDPMNPGEWIAAGAADGSGTARWYTHDALVCLVALCELHAVAPHASYVSAATLAGDFVKNMVALPTAAGYLDATNNAPVNFVDAAGNWDVDIYPCVAYAYIGGMDMLASITADSSYTTTANNARAFYALAQHAQGWWYDHYNTWSNYPTLPPAGYSAANWKKFSEVNSTILADEFLHATLGAYKAGDTAEASAAYDWLVTAVNQNGGVPGYLATGAAGAHGFGVGDVYFDVVSSGEWRSVCLWEGELARAVQAAKFCEASQSADGGHIWGRYRAQGLDATTATGGESAQAPHTGIWCTADLSVYGTSLSPAEDYDADVIPVKRLVSLAVTPSGTNIAAGTQQFTATATYSDATTADVTAAVYWHSDDTGKATIAQTGSATKVTTGLWNAYATIGRFTAYATNSFN